VVALTCADGRPLDRVEKVAVRIEALRRKLPLLIAPMQYAAVNVLHPVNTFDQLLQKRRPARRTLDSRKWAVVPVIRGKNSIYALRF
jgi:hypothetical protein